jgi:hypothetical protein
MALLSVEVRIEIAGPVIDKTHEDVDIGDIGRLDSSDLEC